MATTIVLKCPECRSKKLMKTGKRWSGRKRVQCYVCNNCGRYTVYPKEEKG